MILGIDASNIRAGGGITHLVYLLREAEPNSHGFHTVIVWAPRHTLGRLEERPWMVKRTHRVLEGHNLRRALWQRNGLAEVLRADGCDLLFAPGSLFATDFRPVVTMSRNLLPFEWRELRRYAPSPMLFRLLLLRWAQSRSFRNAHGVIFLTRYAHHAILKVTGRLGGRTAIIPHGIDGRFFQQPRAQRPLAEYGAEHPFRLIYVSIVDTYKHQWYVAEAVAKLRKEGLPVMLDLIGEAYRPALRRLRRALRRVDPAGRIVRYVGEVRHEELPAYYGAAALCVFASSCENLPNILLEAMASGLPIACSKRGPMPEILGSAGVYFDPEDAASIAGAIRELAENPELRDGKALGAYERAHQYSWKRCAEETFEFLAEVAAERGRAPRVAAS
jgi:glycosyltransferase involved in cell wall biosynthesis